MYTLAISGLPVTLTAAPDAGYGVVWSGCTAQSGNTCNINIDGIETVTATFKPLYTLNVNRRYFDAATSKYVTSTGGSVSSNDGLIDCGSDCTEVYPTVDTLVTLTATPDAGNGVVWSGCTPSPSNGNTCAVTMSALKTVTATFKPLYTLAVNRKMQDGDIYTANTGGSVSSNDGLIDCGSDCTAIYPTLNTPVTLTATPDAGNGVVWSGCTSKSGNTCQVTMDAIKTVTATFKPLYTLSISKQGSGSGKVTGGGTGKINCGATCTAEFLANTVVTLTATASNGSYFAEWSGALCIPVDGKPNVCKTTMSASKGVIATFNSSSGGT
ncbi:MAG: hypothetical protein JG718_13710 [Candidatus Thiothrix moscowensis]|nr:hypothetical protein [Candidatus Thiothrix moscowensis]